MRGIKNGPSDRRWFSAVVFILGTLSMILLMGLHIPPAEANGGGATFLLNMDTCTIDLINNTHTCQGITALTFIHEPDNHETVLKVNLDPEYYTGAEFGITYSGTPTDWTVNIGDSETNNGAGGDSATQSNDAELHIRDTTMAAYGNDLAPSNPDPLLTLSNFVSEDSDITLRVSNENLVWNDHAGNFGQLNSPYLYALNGQPDSEGPVNYDIYASFNRVIYAPRHGSGVGLVTVELFRTDSCAPVDGNLIANFCFADGKWPWRFYHNDDQGQYRVSTVNPYVGQYAAEIAIDAQGSNVQFYQKDLVLEPNTTYELSFAARSDDGRDMSVYMHKHEAPYTNYGLSNYYVDLQPYWKHFTVTFTTGDIPENDNSRLRFWFKQHARAGTIYHIDKVVLRPLSTP